MAELTPANTMLTVETLKKDHDVISEQFKITVKGQSEDYDLLVDRWFSKTKTTQLIQELREKLAGFKRNQAEILGQNLYAYIVFLAIKHFTSLDIPEDYGSQLIVLEHLSETGLFTQIVDQLPVGEMEWLFDQIIGTSEKIEQVRMDVINKLYEEGILLENEEIENLLMV